MIDDEICDKLINLDIYVNNEVIIQKIKEYIKKLSLNQDQVFELAKKNYCFIFYLEPNIFDEQFCIRLLNLRNNVTGLNKLVGDKYNQFSRTYFELLIKKFPHEIHTVPNQYR